MRIRQRTLLIVIATSLVAAVLLPGCSLLGIGGTIKMAEGFYSVSQIAFI
jgi:hypothetical protein